MLIFTQKFPFRSFPTTMWMANLYCDVRQKWGPIMQISPRLHLRLQEKSPFPSEVRSVKKKVQSEREQWQTHRSATGWDFTTIFFMMSLSEHALSLWFLPWWSRSQSTFSTLLELLVLMNSLSATVPGVTCEVIFLIVIGARGMLLCCCEARQHLISVEAYLRRAHSDWLRNYLSTSIKIFRIASLAWRWNESNVTFS